MTKESLNVVGGFQEQSCRIDKGVIRYIYFIADIKV